MLLAILRGTADTREIGVTLDPMMAALSVVFMADTYLIEKREQRWEIFALYALDKKRIMVYKRIVVQFVYLFLLAALGYFLFFIQNPSMTTWVNEMKMYLEYLLVVGISLILWGTMAIVIANLFKIYGAELVFHFLYGYYLTLRLGMSYLEGTIYFHMYSVIIDKE